MNIADEVKETEKQISRDLALLQKRLAEQGLHLKSVSMDPHTHKHWDEDTGRWVIDLQLINVKIEVSI